MYVSGSAGSQWLAIRSKAEIRCVLRQPAEQRRERMSGVRLGGLKKSCCRGSPVSVGSQAFIGFESTLPAPE